MHDAQGPKLFVPSFGIVLGFVIASGSYSLLGSVGVSGDGGVA